MLIDPTLRRAVQKFLEKAATSSPSASNAFRSEILLLPAATQNSTHREEERIVDSEKSRNGKGNGLMRQLQCKVLHLRQNIKFTRINKIDLNFVATFRK